MAFPTDRLPVKVELALGADLTAAPGTWSWTDVTQWVRVQQGITMTRGRRDESSTAPPGSCRLTFDNRDGRFTPRNPLGAYYGSLRRNTPLRVRLELPINANPYFETDASNWTGIGGTVARSTAQFHQGVASLLFTPDGVTSSVEARSENVSATVGARYQARAWVRCAVSRTVNININWRDGGGSLLSTSTFSLAVVANTWTLMELTATAPASTAQAQLTVSMGSTPPASHTLHIDEAILQPAGTVRSTGYVSEWPPRWDLSGRDAYVPVEANGVLRRLMQGEKPLVDPLRRAILAQSPKQYWPGTDGSRATQVSSGLAGNPAMVVSGSVRFAAETDLPGSGALPNLDGGGKLIGPVLAYFIGANPSHTVDFWFKSSSAASTTHYPVEFYGDAALARYEVEITSTALNVLIYNTAGSEQTGGALSYTADLTDDEWHNVKITSVSGLGLSADVTLYVDGTQRDTINFPTTAIGRVTGVTANPRSLAGGPLVSVGHVAVFNGNVTTDFTVAGSGHAGEAAGTRIQRICSENSVPYLASGNEADTELMGPQAATLVGVFRDCEATDGGVLYETLTGEIAYQTRRARYNRTVALALNQDSGHIAAPPEPTDDDQLLRNDVTATRVNGSSATYTDTAHIAANGRYDEEVTINVATDEVLPHHAGWRVHLGTVGEMRWPSISMNFARAPSLTTSWLAADIGARVTVANPPDQVVGDAVDVLADGYAEYVDGVRTWTAELMCVPGSPWLVGVYDTARYDTNGSQLNGSHNSSTTSLSVEITLGPLWTTTDVPFDIRCGGERMTVTAVSGSSSPQTFTVTRSVNGVVKSHADDTAVSLWQPAYYAL